MEPYTIASVTVGLCVDCVTADANGADAEGIEPDWCGFLPAWEGWAFGTDADADGEPREPAFGWYPCDGCGSGLGGDRYPYVAVRR
jgi:hypothetical protein